MKILKAIWNKWIFIGKKVGNFNAQIIFSIFYLIFISVPALVIALFFDPFNVKNKKRKTNFSSWQYKREDVRDARMQF